MKGTLFLFVAAIGGLIGFKMLTSPSEAQAAMSSADMAMIGVADQGMPKLEVTTLDGEKLTAKDLEGKVAIVNFWATWCPPCVAEIPSFIELQKEYADKGVQFVGLSVDRGPQSAVAKFAESRKINYPIAVVQSDTFERFGGTGPTPYTLVFNAAGQVTERFVGLVHTPPIEAPIKKAL